LQTRIAGLLTTGVLVVLGPVSVAVAEPGSSGRAPAVHSSTATAGHHPKPVKNKPKAKHRSHKPDSRKAKHRSNKPGSHKSKHLTHKHGTKTHKHGTKPGSNRKSNVHKGTKHSNLPGIFKKNTHKSGHGSGKTVGKKKHSTRQSPRVRGSGGSSPAGRTNAPSLRTPSTPAPQPTAPSAAPTSTAPQPTPAAAAVVQPRTSAVAPAPAPATTSTSHSAAALPQHSSRTSAATSRPAKADTAAVAVPSIERLGLNSQIGRALGGFTPAALGANPLGILGIIAGVGFAVAVGAIVTGYRGTRHI